MTNNLNRNLTMFNRLLILMSSKFDDQIGLDEQEDKERLGLIKYFEEYLKWQNLQSIT